MPFGPYLLAAALLLGLAPLGACHMTEKDPGDELASGAEPDDVSEPDRWSGYLGVPSDSGPPTFYAYWLGTDGAFAFREVEGLPPPGPLNLPSAPESTGTETTVPAATIVAFASSIERRGAFDRAVEEDTAGSGYSIRDGRVRLFASRSFSVRSVAALLLVVGAVAGVGVALSVSTRRLRRERDARQEAVEARGRMAEVREAERARLAREIHDGPIQNLHALRVAAHAAALHAGSTHDAGDALEGGLQGVSQELRAIMEGLHPPALDRFGFAAAVESHAARVSGDGAEVEVSIDPDAERALGAGRGGARLGVFRIVQEAISNAVQHGARSVDVRVSLDGARVVASVSDDGPGFDAGMLQAGALGAPDALVARGHYGLVGMAERAEVLGGTLTFGAGEQGGVEVRLDIPVDPEPTASEGASR